MKKRPILFSAPMVRALLDGSKTQTRRVVTPTPVIDVRYAGGAYIPTGKHGDLAIDAPHISLASPYGQPGDRLWVRETWCHQWDDFTGYQEDKFFYRASTPDVQHVDGAEKSPWKPSIHMPRAASRITLEITGVRVERLQDISEADAVAEGVKNSLHLPGGRFARENYEHLWWTINGDGSWEANPWVWVIEFRKVTP
jgi:hypothetical protein